MKEESFTGAKHDLGKVRMDLIDPYFEEDLGRVMTQGAVVYGAESWKTVVNGSTRYLAAMKRHTNAIAKGELIDNTSGLPHAAHIAANAMFLHYFQAREQYDADMEDAQMSFDFAQYTE